MDAPPGLELFSTYETEYSQLYAAIRRVLDKEAKSATGEQRKTILRRVERDLEEADEIVSQMDIELQGLDRNLKAKMQGKLRGYRADLVKAKNEAKQLSSNADRDDLLSRGGSYSDNPYASPSSPPPGGSSTSQSQAQRSRLLQGTQMLADGQRRLEDSHRVALETEDLGAGILRDLQGQREQLEGTSRTLGEADGQIDKASNTLNQMIRRMYRQRVVTIAIIVVLVVLIGIVLFSKFR